MRRSFIFFLILTLFFAFPANVKAESGLPPYIIFLPGLNNNYNPQNEFISLPAFSDRVNNGDASIIRGVYVSGVMAYRVVQQPQDDSNFVTLEPDAVTQYSLASLLGVTGILAHNTLAGKDFNQIRIGDIVQVVYGDSHIKSYRVVSSLGYEVLEPQNPNSNFRDIQTNEIITLSSLFSMYYMGEHHLTLQTCIENQGDPGWGRLFIKAIPLP